MRTDAPPQGGATGANNAPAFGHVQEWVFDLDNTLYPHEARIWPQVDERITLFVSGLFGIDGLSARALQKYFYFRYGTTLKGLQAEQQIEPATFLDFVHDIDLSELAPDLPLKDAIGALPGRKFVMTNGSLGHAERITARLGIDHLFAGMFDIAAAGLVPKPERQAYDIFLDRFGIDPRQAAMFEDIERNLAVPNELGMKTVLIIPKTLDPFREPHEQIAVLEPHVHHVTNDLAGFLRDLRAGERAAG